MKVTWFLFSLLSLCSIGECLQPYFPTQVTFSPDNGQTIIAVDQINQRAYQKIRFNSNGSETSYVMKHFPYAPSDSPQSEYYVQLSVDTPPLGCTYGTYWKYGGNIYNSFPSHWLNNRTSFQIKTYLQFQHLMIHSNHSSSEEDYWYANVTCQVDGGETYPCEEIYFKKNTEIPLRSTRVARVGWDAKQLTTSYQIQSIGKPDEKLFDSIPKNWANECRDVMLGLLLYSQTNTIQLNQSAEVHVWLITPPHRVNGNDTVQIQWKSTQCSDCLTWTPKQLSFNIQNFQQKQILTITRVKDGPKTTLIPIFNGGGFDLVVPDIYPIFIE